MKRATFFQNRAINFEITLQNRLKASIAFGKPMATEGSQKLEEMNNKLLLYFQLRASIFHPKVDNHKLVVNHHAIIK